ncbi:MAG: hypothetical protein QJR02_01775 [Sinobacteraceae bacterium]|nr:hypothetical protein [Nevskiaceae bacterium]
MAKVFTEAELRPGSEEWLDWQRGGITGSDIYVLACHASELVLDVQSPPSSPVNLEARPSWMHTPRQLFERKLKGGGEKRKEGVEARGKRLAALVREGACRKFKASFKPLCVSVDCGSADHLLRVTLDAVDLKRSALLDITAPRKRWDKVPDYAIVRSHYERAVLEQAGLVKGGDFSLGIATAYDDPEMGRHKVGDLSYDTYKVEYDASFGSWLLDVAQAFARRTLVPGGMLPPPVAKDVVRRGDVEWVEAADRFRHADAAVAEAQTELNAARAALLSLIAEGDTHSYEGGGVRVLYGDRKGPVNYKAALDVHAPDVDVEPFRKKGGAVRQVIVL